MAVVLTCTSPRHRITTARFYTYTTLDKMADMINNVNMERLKKGEVNLGVSF
jgi:hypothetical protein